MSFTDRKPFVATEKDCSSFRKARRWLCPLCGHTFNVGDTVRWIYANGTKDIQTGNFFVCEACDNGDDLSLMIKAKESLARATDLAKRWDIYGPEWQQSH